ncbi:response regulator (plasmid) [Acaryochloris sp. 'Moss Beach']|uniref:response regulator transcription factor RpaB n=1 Tax=Acaryochloris TaxID=155977 RepID=UPI001BAF78F7|nr:MULTISPECIES: response regulator [Acaryochloris]QUY40387.1 response regulator [Acaryochloris marina S15]UJB72807.1 response regulator [Acaryochloris sp. 'Moss Beach']
MTSVSMNNPSNDQHSILIVDDEASIRRILSARLTMVGYQVFTAADGIEALEVFEHQNPDLIVLDVMMPKLDGYGVCQAVRKISRVPIIMLTALSDVRDRITGLEMGADDYMVKPFSPKELESRVRSILRRLDVLKPSNYRLTGVIEMGSLHIDTNKRQVCLDEERISLTYVEYSLLELLASRPGEAVPRQELLEKVWGYSKESIVDTRVVDVHMSRLRKKLKADLEESELFQTVRGVGYALKYDQLHRLVEHEAS